MKFKAVFYDLDGTIIDSIALHREAWNFAANQFGINLKPRTLIELKGTEGNEVARLIMREYGLSNKKNEEKILKIKRDYLAKNYDQAKIFQGFFETVEELQKMGLIISICTTMTERFVKMIAQLKSFENNIVWREMYDFAKPAAEPLLVTAAKAQIIPSDCAYVGDTYNDYLSAKAAGMEFFYFNPLGSEFDPRLRGVNNILRQHADILKCV